MHEICKKKEIFPLLWTVRQCGPAGIWKALPERTMSRQTAGHG